MMREQNARAVNFTLASAQARLIIERARKEWGADVNDQSTMHHAIVRLFMGGDSTRGQRGRRPVGAFSIRWRTPSEDQATIDRIEWDPELGGSDQEVCQVIDSLAGWPLAH